MLKLEARPQPSHLLALTSPLIALALIPVAPPGVPILASMFGVAVALVWPSGDPGAGEQR